MKNVKSMAIPEGKANKITVGGVTIWEGTKYFIYSTGTLGWGLSAIECVTLTGDVIPVNSKIKEGTKVWFRPILKSGYSIVSNAYPSASKPYEVRSDFTSEVANAYGMTAVILRSCYSNTGVSGGAGKVDLENPNPFAVTVKVTSSKLSSSAYVTLSIPANYRNTDYNTGNGDWAFYVAVNHRPVYFDTYYGSSHPPIVYYVSATNNIYGNGNLRGQNGYVGSENY